ncbi:uncharacterized protein LOC141668177 [Apium graveolens]|uniref:uncharacterized protein LOC141668177 n=1 Tax=Apium graveolens TaxID=4045 RepID=UPI003D7A9D05
MGASPVSTPFSQLSCYTSSNSISSLSQLHSPDFSYRKFSPPFSVSCALSRSRRLVSVSLISLCCTCSIPNLAVAGGFDKYLKRKKLDPLEAYVPAVILTQLQIEDLGKILDVDKPQYATYRNLLRSGPAASLRVNIRAVAQYAAEAGYDKTAYNNVDQCLGALEELDSLLLRASRNDGETSVKSMKLKIGIAVDALNSLLKTVPSEVLSKGKEVADAYLTPEESVPTDKLDPDVKQLESIL